MSFDKIKKSNKLKMFSLIFFKNGENKKLNPTTT